MRHSQQPHQIFCCCSAIHSCTPSPVAVSVFSSPWSGRIGRSFDGVDVRKKHTTGGCEKCVRHVFGSFGIGTDSASSVIVSVEGAPSFIAKVTVDDEHFTTIKIGKTIHPLRNADHGCRYARSPPATRDICETPQNIHVGEPKVENLPGNSPVLAMGHSSQLT